MNLIKIRFKNFLSFGNNWTELDLNNNKLNLISGLNGKGKSTLAESIFFGLTGKTYRKIKKENLVNNLNRKNLVVELTTTHLNSEYLIRRGLKPNIFEIFKDGELVNEDSHVKDYQKQLELMLGFDYKTIKQVIILSTRYYTPFLDLSALEKREFIENIFSIKLFSDMNNMLKARIQSTKLMIKDVLKEIEKIESNLKILAELNEKAKENAEEQKNKILEEIESLDQNLSSFEENLIERQQELEFLTNQFKEQNTQLNIKTKIDKQSGLCDFKRKRVIDKIDFFNKNDICVTCGQSINDEFKKEKISTYEEELSCILEKEEKLKKAIEKIQKISDKLSKLSDQISEQNKKIIQENSKIYTTKQIIIEKKKKFNEINESIVDEKSIDELKHQIDLLLKKKIKLEEFLKYINITIELLSERGIKRFIVDKYLPIFNSILNQFLKLFEAYFSVIFDDEFNEKIIIKGREGQNYFSLSSGEKQRLDLAMLFTFVEISRIKNSVNTNLIFFDEILDSSLDQSGMDGVIKIFSDLKNKGFTIFNISHRDGINQLFDVEYKINKKRFSEVEIIEGDDLND